MKRGRAGGKARSAVNAALRVECDAVRALLTRADLSEVDARYQIGAVVAKVRDAKGNYGEAPVEALAEAVQRDSATLYRYAKVVDMVPPGEMRALSRRTDRRGYPLSWSHWMLLTTVVGEWRRWYLRTLDEGWTVRALSAELDASQATRSDPKAIGTDTTRLALQETVRSMRRFGTEVTTSLEAVLERIARSPEREKSPEIDDLLANTLELFVAAHRKTGEIVTRMRALGPAKPPGNVIAFPRFPGRDS